MSFNLVVGFWLLLVTLICFYNLCIIEGLMCLFTAYLAFRMEEVLDQPAGRRRYERNKKRGWF